MRIQLYGTCVQEHTCTEIVYTSTHLDWVELVSLIDQWRGVLWVTILSDAMHECLLCRQSLHCMNPSDSTCITGPHRQQWGNLVQHCQTYVCISCTVMFSQGWYLCMCSVWSTQPLDMLLNIASMSATEPCSIYYCAWKLYTKYCSTSFTISLRGSLRFLSIHTVERWNYPIYWGCSFMAASMSPNTFCGICNCL